MSNGDADGNESHDISVDDAAKLTTKYRQEFDIEDSKGFYFGRAKIEKILDQGGCKGIRVYCGINSIGEDTLVLVGVNQSWDDIVSNVAEYGISTATHADSSSSALARD